MRVWQAHALLTGAYLLSRFVLHASGLRFSFSLDWMWLADPLDLRDRLLETLWYFHAFPPGPNALTGILLKIDATTTSALAHALFAGLGVLLVNLLFHLARIVGLAIPFAFGFAIAFALTPAAIYFEHLFHYEWPIAALLCAAAALFHRAIAAPAFRWWLAFFTVAAVIGSSRSTFHLIWYVALAALGAWLVPRPARRIVLAGALLPAVLLLSLYLKNLVVFGEFAASTFGPASLTLVTLHRLPDDARAAWARSRAASPFAPISVYAPPRTYSPYFGSADRPEWPAQVTRLDHRGVQGANFNHWWLLEVHRARKHDVWLYITERPLEYLGNALAGLRDMFRPTTRWHPRDNTPSSPHFAHRQALGDYEGAVNRVLHTRPLAPFGVYVALPFLLAWVGWRAWRVARSDERWQRARAGLLLLCVFHVVYVVAASTLLTHLEMPRYRFQAEWAIWLLAVAAVTPIARRSGGSELPPAAVRSRPRST